MIPPATLRAITFLYRGTNSSINTGNHLMLSDHRKDVTGDVFEDIVSHSLLLGAEILQILDENSMAMRKIIGFSSG